MADLAPECPICYDGPAVEETACRHRFCKVCLAAWLATHHTCPLCRAVVQPPAPAGGLAAFAVCLPLRGVRFDPAFPRRLRLAAAAARRLRLRWWLTIDGSVLAVWLGRHRLLTRSCYDVARMVHGATDTALHVRLGGGVAAVRWRDDAGVSGRVREWFRLVAGPA